MLKPKQKYLFTVHPILHELQINEDGSEVIWEGKPLKVHVQYKREGGLPHRYVHFGGRTHRITKLVCEAWHGMRPKGYEYAVRKQVVDNDHYSNLYWGEPGTNTHGENARRSSRSKIRNADVPKILNQILEGVPIATIAVEYNTSAMSIYRVKKRYLLKV